MIKQLPVLAAMVFVVGGCVVGPEYHRPQVAMPARFNTGPLLLPTTIQTLAPTTQASTTQPTTPGTRPTAAATRAATRSAAKPVDLTRWWGSFDDPVLDRLVDQAVQADYNLAIAVARLQEAREGLAGVNGYTLPYVGASAGLGRGSGTNSARGRVAAPLHAGTNTGGLDEITHVAGFDAAWEVDLFGRVTREIQAASADAQAADEDRKQVLVTVVGEVVRSYVELRSLQLRLEITRENVAALRRTADLVRVRLNRGLGGELEVVLAERQVSAALARVAPLQALIRNAERRLALLTGADPATLIAELDRQSPVPSLGADVDVGVPLDLLRRRPDIQRAERRLAAATARIGVATADLFPQISLTGGFGFQGQGLGATPVESAVVWSFGPAIRWPLLDFGRVDALIQVRNFQAREFLIAYRAAVVTAVQEVEDAMTSYAAEKNRFAQLAVAVSSSERAVNLASQRFDLGLTDFLNVLDAQRQLYDLQDQLAVSQQAVTLQLITLYKSLGGGWESFGTVPMPPTPQPALIAAGREAFQRRR